MPPSAPTEIRLAKPRSVTGTTPFPLAVPAVAPCTRRRSLELASLALVGLALKPAVALARAFAGPAMSDPPRAPATTGLTSLHQEFELNAIRERIYDILLDAKEFSAFTHDAAVVGPKAGRAFSLFGGRITGRNVELVPAERIVQAWRSRSWGPGVYSIVRFGLSARSDKTLVVLDHTGFPDGDGDNLASGWREHYWEPLANYLG